MIKKLIALSLVVLSCTAMMAQSRTIAEFEKENHGWNLHLYQSMIRLLNKDADNDFNELIKDLESVQVLVTDSASKISLQSYKALATSIASEGYEVMLDIDNKDVKASIYQLETRGGKVSWVAFAYSVEMGRTFAFEMNGELNMKYLDAFKSIDLDKVMNIAESQNN